ncbi:MAG: TIR domain-containing protein [Vicinamibacterales bacterium]
MSGVRSVSPLSYGSLALPTLRPGAELDIEALREPGERLYLGVIVAFNVLVFLALAGMLFAAPEMAIVVVVVAAFIALANWVSIKLMFAYIDGHGIRVGPQQYPQIYEVVRDAAASLKVPVPTIVVLAGAGLVEILVAKWFTRRGLIIVTSDLMDALIESGTSRELMMLVGRQLGHIKAGHFRHWVFKDVIGACTFLIHKAYWRRCHLTADRVGMMVAGDYYAAEQGLLVITVGPKLAAHTNIDEVEVQAEHLRDQFWARVQRWISDYPYMVDRLVHLREFADSVHGLRQSTSARPAIGALPIRHMRLQSLPLMVVHGHDHTALLELKDFLRARYPYIEPVVMALETLGSATMPEKFERLAAQARGAIALLTPDDIASSVRTGSPTAARARQNVVLEIGWFWGRLGRARCLLLSRGQLEMPSDLSGVDCLEFARSPREQFESVRDFIARLESLESGLPSIAPGGDRHAEVRPSFEPDRAEHGADDMVSLSCASCAHRNPADSRFCEECGTPCSAVTVV